jgi:hypothetical protein
MSSTPEHRRKVSEGQKRRLQDPLFRARKQAILRRNQEAGLAKPEVREKIARIAKANVPLMFTPEALKRKRESEARRRQSISDVRLAWCPLRYRDEYRKLVDSKRIPAAEAKRIILQTVLSDRRRAERKERGARSFEETLRLVAEGRLNLVANTPIPSRQYDRTLGGVSAL